MGEVWRATGCRIGTASISRRLDAIVRFVPGADAATA
jgi:hypothetical protein